MSKPLLDVQNLHVSYGAINAVSGISFELFEGEIVAIVGSNGAGKTTTLRAISGLEKVKSGSILLGDQELVGLPAHKIVEAGVAHVPEGRRAFPEMTVLENLELGANLEKNQKVIKQRLEKVFDTFPRLAERMNQIAGTLSGGEQQMLAVGRALMTNGKILLMDEPSMGLAPIIVEEIFNIIKTLNKMGKSILLIEQNAYLALHTAKRAYVFESGTIRISGNSDELLQNPLVKEAYLGA